MISFIQSLLAFIVALGVLITFHEFGHFWVARKCNVKILRFSIGFGKPIYKRFFGEDKTEFVIAALPLGGYVKMLDEREGEVHESEIDRAFSAKPLLQRLAIVIAGPLFNFIFAVFAYWVMYMVGISGLKPLIGKIESASMAAHAGFEIGDEIVKVDGRKTPIWSTVIDVLVANIVKENKVTFTLKGENAYEREIELDLSKISIDELAGGRLLHVIGLDPLRPRIPAVIGEVSNNSPAERAGFKAGDEVIAVEGQAINDWLAWVEVIRQHPNESLNVEIMRDNNTNYVSVIPDKIQTDDGEFIGRIGAIVDTDFKTEKAFIAKESYYFLPALVKSIDKTIEMSILTLRILGKMIIGEASVKNLSGPITIAQYAGHSAGLGLATFLGFLAIVSVSLGVLNILPIPLLDGGHIFYYLVEFVKGSPVSESVQLIGQQIGIVVLFSLMGLAFYNDILRLMS